MIKREARDHRRRERLNQSEPAVYQNDRGNDRHDGGPDFVVDWRIHRGFVLVRQKRISQRQTRVQFELFVTFVAVDRQIVFLIDQ